MNKALAYLAAGAVAIAIPFGVKAAGFNPPAPKLAVTAVYIAALWKVGFINWAIDDRTKD